MGTKFKEIKLVSYMKKHQDKVNNIQKTFVALFNECGIAYDDSSMQLALTGGIITMLLKNSKMPSKEIKILLENVSKKFK